MTCQCDIESNCNDKVQPLNLNHKKTKINAHRNSLLSTVSKYSHKGNPPDWFPRVFFTNKRQIIRNDTQKLNLSD